MILAPKHLNPKIRNDLISFHSMFDSICVGLKCKINEVNMLINTSNNPIKFALNIFLENLFKSIDRAIAEKKK